MAVLAVLLAGAFGAGAAAAADRVIEPTGPGLAAAIATAGSGDRLLLRPGRYKGPVVIDRPLAIIGRPGVVIDGGGKSSTIRIAAPDVTIRGVTVTGSGLNPTDMDSGIFVGKKGRNARIEGNRIENNLFGVYLWGSRDAVVRDNDILGRRDLRVNERGNGVSVWNAPGSIVDGNRFRDGRDGIFVMTSKRNRFTNNLFRGVRIAIHYMYANDSEVSGNLSIGNHIGFALMYSKRLRIVGNVSMNDRDHGILLNFANRSLIKDNWVKDGKNKCVFIYNSSVNTFTGNRFEGCAIGVQFTAGSERNLIYGNAFIANRTQVKYVGTRRLDWSHDGRGNYWSDNPAFDLDGDGIADAVYRPNDIMDQVMWAHPRAKLLLSAPAVQILRLAQSQFPAIRPGGVFDSAPLMTPPTGYARGVGTEARP